MRASPLAPANTPPGTMGDMQHFCLRWNNYQSSITSAFENLRDDEDFVDVTLACDGKSLKAHRVVLSACSPYFRELLKSTPCKHPVIVLQDVTYEDLAALVEFIYHGEVNVRQRCLSSFLKTAEILRVSGLTQQSEGMPMGLEKGGFLEGRDFPQQNRKQSHPVHRQRERPHSQPNTPDHNQESIVPVKKCRAEAGGGSGDSPPREPEEEPPMDFSASAVGHNSVKAEAPSPGEARDGGDHDSEESGGGGAGGGQEYGEGTGPPPDHPPTPDSINQHNYLESKLFAAAGAGFNFSMAAALAADSLAGLNSQHHPLTDGGGGGGGGGLAGTSSSPGLRKVFTCMACGKVLCSKASLKRHVADKHASRQEEYRCAICERVYCSRNSLMTHIYTYHKSQRPADYYHHTTTDVKF